MLNPPQQTFQHLWGGSTAYLSPLSGKHVDDLSHSMNMCDFSQEVEAKKPKFTGDKERGVILSMPPDLANFPSHKSWYSLDIQYYGIPLVELMREIMGPDIDQIDRQVRSGARGKKGKKIPTPIECV